MLLEFWDSCDSHYKEIETDEIEVDNKTIEQIKNESYNQALEDLYKLDYCTECEKQGYSVDCYYCRVNNAQQWFLEQLKKQK